MLRSTIRTRTARFVVVAGALLALTAGGAYATAVLGSPVGADGVIHGCYQKFNGALHLVAADDPACRANEQPIVWSQTGPKGEKGDAGVKGDAGEKGGKGDTGAPGAPGRAGVSGYEIRVNDFTVPAGAAGVASASCPAGKKVVGGGAWLFSGDLSDPVTPHVVQSAPVDDSTWEVKIDAGGTIRDWSYRLQAICVNAG
jgi:hypothetical protein